MHCILKVGQGLNDIFSLIVDFNPLILKITRKQINLRTIAKF